MTGKVPDKHPGVSWCSAKRSMYYELFFVEEEEDQKEGGAPNVQKVSPDGSIK